MFKLIGISLILAVIRISESSPLYQFLPPREGYIPVYIRLGDTPLDEINPDLASAFHESSIETRNALDSEDQMQNDAPYDENLSESAEDVQKKITISKDSNSEEEQRPTTPVKTFDAEPDSDEKIEQPQRDSSVPDKKSGEEVDSKEEADLKQSTKDNESEEIAEPSTTNKAKSNDNSSEEVTKSKTVPPAPKKDTSSEEEVENES